MKASKQCKHINTGFEVSNHAFINQLAAGIQKKIQEKVPGFLIKIGGKSESGSTIKMVLSGSMVTTDADKHQEISNKVRQTIDDLKNPSDLLSTIE